MRPTCWADCGALLLGEDASPSRHQVAEIPHIELEMVEYRCHTVHYLACGKANLAQWSEENADGAFGPRLMATTSYLTGQMGMSQRDVEELNQKDHLA